MGFLAKLFGSSEPRRPEPACALEAYVAKLTPATMSRKVRSAEEEFKTPVAQAMAVLAFSGSFAKGLRESANGMPDFMRSEWPFPYERVLTEAAAFYYFYMIKDYVSKPDAEREDDEDNEWEDDEGQEGEPAPSDPYFEALKMSMVVCGTLIHTLTNERISKEFVGGRAITLASIHNSPSRSVTEALAGFIMAAWNPDPSGRPSLDLSAPAIPIQISIAAMPIDAVRDACRELYDERRGGAG